MALKDLIPWRKSRREDEESRLPAEAETEELFREFLEDMFRPWALMRMRPSAGLPRRFHPSVDITETDREYRVTAELPGLSRDDVEVSLDEGVLTISGQKNEEEREEKEDYVRVERSYGSFSRSIPLPSQVDQAGVEARFEDGVLSVHLPKREEARGKKVEIKGG